MPLFYILLSVISLFASNYESGRDIYFQHGCSNCHGIHAEGSGSYPRLANKTQIHIIKKLKRFQNGKASSQAGEIMFEFARSLSHNDLENVSYFLSQHKEESSDKYEISDDILGSVD